ncbi:MAG: DNA-binding protein [Planctomycetota bacterium]|nr:MAG: DNA-binding protein [Planctomycetota bacterium]
MRTKALPLPWCSMNSTRDRVPAWAQDVAASLPPLATRQEVADWLRVSPRTVARYIDSGRLASIRLTAGPGSGGVRIPRCAAAAFLAATTNARRPRG